MPVHIVTFVKSLGGATLNETFYCGNVLHVFEASSKLATCCRKQHFALAIVHATFHAAMQQYCGKNRLALNMNDQPTGSGTKYQLLVFCVLHCYTLCSLRQTLPLSQAIRYNANSNRDLLVDLFPRAMSRYFSILFKKRKMCLRIC